MYTIKQINDYMDCVLNPIFPDELFNKSGLEFDYSLRIAGLRCMQIYVCSNIIN